MNNQDLNVIKPNLDNNVEVLDEGVVTNKPVSPQKKKPIILIFVLVLAIVLFVGYYLLFGGKSGNLTNNKEEVKDEKVKIESEYEWANKYGDYIQDYFDKLDKFDIAFVNLNNDEVPELVINYANNSKGTEKEVLFIKNNSVSKTRAFDNAELYLITPVNLEEVEWYLYIGDKEYGKYTIVSQLIDGTALDATIKVTNPDEIIKFGNEYLHSDFKLTYYEIEKNSFKDDYMTKLSRYESDQEKINEEIDKLKESRNTYITDKSIDVNSEKVIKLHSYTLDVGEYRGNIYTTVDGKTTTSTDILIIKSLNTLSFHEKELKFTVAGDTLTCEDGTVFTAVGNNQLQIMDEEKGPIIYKIPIPDLVYDEEKNSN